MAKAISEIHEIGKYPVQEKKERRNHLLRNLGIGVGIPTAIIGGFFGYKAFTNNNQVSTAEVQRALVPQDKKVEVVKKNYGQEAVKDLNAGVLPIEDYSSYYEVGKYTQKDNSNLGPDFWNSIYGALVKYDSTLEGKYIKFIGLVRFGRKRMNEIIQFGQTEKLKNPTKELYPDFMEGFGVGIRPEGLDTGMYIVVKEKNSIKVYGKKVVGT